MTWARSPTCPGRAVGRVDVRADLDHLAGDLVADGARGSQVLVAVVEDLDVGAAGGAVAHPQLDLVGRTGRLVHLLEPDVLGGVEAQCLHPWCLSVGFVWDATRDASSRERKRPHQRARKSARMLGNMPECVQTDGRRRVTRVTRPGQREGNQMASTATTPRRRGTGPRAEVRHLPVQHGPAEHRRVHRLGPDHRAVHPERVDHLVGDKIFGYAPGWSRVSTTTASSRLRRLGRRARRHRRPDDHLPAADPDRLHRRPDGLRATSAAAWSGRSPPWASSPAPTCRCSSAP